MAALRLYVPAIFESGGPMEAGKTKLSQHKLDLVDAMVVAADPNVSDEMADDYESWTFEGSPHICESQDVAIDDILNDRVQAGDVVVIRYEGLFGGPGIGDALSY